MQTNRKNIDPSMVEDKRTHFRAVRLVAAASNAHPTKSGQNQRAGIQGGTISWTNCGPLKCSGAKQASEAAMKTGAKEMSFSQPRAVPRSLRRIKTPATR